MTILASDTFVRGASSDLGTLWTPTVGGDGAFSMIAGNLAQPTSLAADSSEYYSGITWPNDQYAQIVIGAMTGGTGAGGAGIGPGVRYSTTQRTGYRLVVNNGATSNWAIHRFLNTIFSPVGAETTQVVAVGGVIRLEVTGQNEATRLVAKYATPGAPTSFTTIIDQLDMNANQINTGNAAITYSSTLTTAAASSWAGGDFGPDLTWEQEGYQWRRDDGSELAPGSGGASYIGAQDNPL